MNTPDPSATDNQRELTQSFATVKITFLVAVTQASFLYFEQVLLRASQSYFCLPAVPSEFRLVTMSQVPWASIFISMLNYLFTSSKQHIEDFQMTINIFPLFKINNWKSPRKEILKVCLSWSLKKYLKTRQVMQIYLIIFLAWFDYICWHSYTTLQWNSQPSKSLTWSLCGLSKPPQLHPSFHSDCTTDLSRKNWPASDPGTTWKCQVLK